MRQALKSSADISKPTMAQLLVDRYSFSGVAYSGAKGLDREWCLTFEEGLPAPDMVIFLDIDPRVAALRDEYGGERFEKVEFQGLVRSGFQQLRGDSWLWVDATRDKAEISAELLGAVAECIEAHCTSPVREM
jgi:dTMP kinase